MKAGKGGDAYLRKWGEKTDECPAGKLPFPEFIPVPQVESPKENRAPAIPWTSANCGPPAYDLETNTGGTIRHGYPKFIALADWNPEAIVARDKACQVRDFATDPILPQMRVNPLKMGGFTPGGALCGWLNQKSCEASGNRAVVPDWIPMGDSGEKKYVYEATEKYGPFCAMYKPKSRKTVPDGACFEWKSMEYAYKYDIQQGTSKEVPWADPNHPKMCDPLDGALVPREEPKKDKPTFVQPGFRQGGGDNGGNVIPLFGYKGPEGYPEGYLSATARTLADGSKMGGFPYNHPDGVSFDGWNPPQTLQNMVSSDGRKNKDGQEPWSACNSYPMKDDPDGYCQGETCSILAKNDNMKGWVEVAAQRNKGVENIKLSGYVEGSLTKGLIPQTTGPARPQKMFIDSAFQEPKKK